MDKLSKKGKLKSSTIQSGASQVLILMSILGSIFYRWNVNNQLHSCNLYCDQKWLKPK